MADRAVGRKCIRLAPRKINSESHMSTPQNILYLGVRLSTCIQERRYSAYRLGKMCTSTTHCRLLTDLFSLMINDGILGKYVHIQC
jgi:hypothetical protein